MRTRPINRFKKIDKKSEDELFAIEKERFQDKKDFNEYAKILSESKTWSDAVAKFRENSEKCLREADVWRKKVYKKNPNIVNGYNYEDDREYCATITSINEKRRCNTIRNLEKRAAEYLEYEKILRSRIKPV